MKTVQNFKSAYPAPAGSAQPSAQEQAAMRGDRPDYSRETAGPRHIQVQEFDGFGPLTDPYQWI